MSQEMQQPGDIADHIAMLVSAVESASHDLCGASARAAAKEAETLLVEEIDREQARAYAEGRKDEREATIAEISELLPASYYMDPPDGGNVSVMEQLRRMAEDATKWRNQAGEPQQDEGGVIAYKFQSPDGSYWYIKADDARTLDYWRDKRKLIPLTADKARIAAGVVIETANV